MNIEQYANESESHSQTARFVFSVFLYLFWIMQSGNSRREKKEIAIKLNNTIKNEKKICCGNVKRDNEISLSVCIIYWLRWLNDSVENRSFLRISSKTQMPLPHICWKWQGKKPKNYIVSCDARNRTAWLLHILYRTWYRIDVICILLAFIDIYVNVCIFFFEYSLHARHSKDCHEYSDY